MKISVVDTPETRVLSQTPSSLSVIITIDVTVTARKKINLKPNFTFYYLTVFAKNYINVFILIFDKADCS